MEKHEGYSQVAIAVLGLRHGARHVAGIRALAASSRFYVCDIDDKRLSAIQPTFNLTADKEWTIIPTDTSIAIVSLPNDLHANALAWLGERTSAILLCEKPLLRTVHDALLIPVEVRGRIRTICELRMNSMVSSLRMLIHRQRVHALRLAWRRNTLPSAAWYLDAAKAGGGALMDLGVHLLDLLQFLIPNDFNSLRVANSALETAPSVSVEIGGRALLEGLDYPVWLDVGWFGGTRGIEIEVEVVLENGTIARLSSHTGTHRLLVDCKGTGHLEDWYIPLLNGHPLPFAGFDDSMNVLRLLECIYATARHP